MVLDGADAVLAAFGVDRSATGTVTFAAGTAGVGAAAELRCCRDGGRETPVGAVVGLAPVPRVCTTILGVDAGAAL